MTISIKDFKELSSELDSLKLRRTILTLLLKTQNVERGSLWISHGYEYECIEALGKDSEEVLGIKIPADEPSVVGWVIAHGKMTVAEAGKDDRHNHKIEDDFKVKSKSILCFPLLLKNGEVYGAVQLIETSTEGDRMNLDPEFLDRIQEMVDLSSIALNNSLEFEDQKRKYIQLTRTLSTIREKKSVVGQSPKVKEALTLAANYAATDYPVLLYGESGTGKELFANEIHSHSSRVDKPFLTQNCSAIPDSLLESELFGYKKGAFTGANTDKPGLFEAADGGTIFLDEIGDMDVNLQAKLLRVLQENEIKPLGGTGSKKINVRIISATNKDLAEEVRTGQFREDLYYRLNVLPLNLPALREREEDIPLLADHFLGQEAATTHTRHKELTPRAMKALCNYDWPGNIRELENTIKQFQATVSGGQITFESLPKTIRNFRKNIDSKPAETEQKAPQAAKPVQDLSNMTWNEMEREYILCLLKKCKWNISEASRKAAINRSTFDSRMKRLGLSKKSS
jgi:transcriptional regulator with GAF, ATPase, and Fis domain